MYLSGVIEKYTVNPIIIGRPVKTFRFSALKNKRDMRIFMIMPVAIIFFIRVKGSANQTTIDI